MIKLIATDMDGTLLDDNKQLPENFDNIVKRLFNKNIRFVISSGRSYCTLKKQFSEYLDDMTFIATMVHMLLIKENFFRFQCCQRIPLKKQLDFATN